MKNADNKPAHKMQCELNLYGGSKPPPVRETDVGRRKAALERTLVPGLGEYLSGRALAWRAQVPEFCPSIKMKTLSRRLEGGHLLQK